MPALSKKARRLRLTPVPEPFRSGLLALVLAALIAGASQGGPVWTALREGSASRSARLDAIAELMALGVIAAAAITFLAHFVLSARRRVGRPSPRALRRALGVAAIAVVVAALVTSFLGDRGRPQAPGGGPLKLEWFSGFGLANDPEGSVPTDPIEYVVEGTDNGPPEPRGRSVMLLLLLVAVAAMIVGALLLRWYRRQSSIREAATEAGEAVEERERIEVHDALVGSIEAMLRDPDPRTAIIGAYAFMLDALADYGLGRRSHEGPMEHLIRVLSSAQVPTRPLRQLVNLFELARFSTHPLSGRHRDQALQALRAAAAGLAAKSPPPTSAAPLAGLVGDR